MAMFFGEENRLLQHQVIHHGIFQDLARYAIREVPTHTEDGIPIRKLYVSNLPPKTTRTEIFGVFAQYGFIKSCWLRMSDNLNKPSTPTYAFVTFDNPADAHKALQAPSHEKTLRGRSLKISPADSWHQPSDSSDAPVRRRTRSRRKRILSAKKPESPVLLDVASNSAEPLDPSQEGATAAQSTADSGNSSEGYEGCNILRILNRDCLNHIFTFMSISDLIGSERVSKGWQLVVHDYLQSFRTFKTSSWKNEEAVLTTAVLRNILKRMGPSLTRLHIDHHHSALNDRIAHVVGKFCPNIEELKITGIYTKNWNPLAYGCKKLKTLSFISCSKLTDISLVPLVKPGSNVENLTVANNTHVTGLFLSGLHHLNITTLSFYNCCSLQGTVLCAALSSLHNITTLKLDMGPLSLWKMMPKILMKMPKLQELSLRDYMAVEVSVKPYDTEPLCEALTVLTELRSLNLSGNKYTSNALLKQLGQSCKKLRKLDVSCCNSRQSNTLGVSDIGLIALCRGCTQLRHIEVSYLAALTDDGIIALTGCPTLECLVSRGNSSVTTRSFVKCLKACRQLGEVDVCGCDRVTRELVEGAKRALQNAPRPLALYLAGTPAATALSNQEFTHNLITLDFYDDRSNLHLRPDFVDRVYTIDDDSDDSFDFEDHENFEDIYGSDEDYYVGVSEFEEMFRLDLHLQSADVILL